MARVSSGAPLREQGCWSASRGFARTLLTPDVKLFNTNLLTTSVIDNDGLAGTIPVSRTYCPSERRGSGRPSSAFWADCAGRYKVSSPPQTGDLGLQLGQAHLQLLACRGLGRGGRSRDARCRGRAGEDRPEPTDLLRAQGRWWTATSTVSSEASADVLPDCVAVLVPGLEAGLLGVGARSFPLGVVHRALVGARPRHRIDEGLAAATAVLTGAVFLPGEALVVGPEPVVGRAAGVESWLVRIRVVGSRRDEDPLLAAPDAVRPTGLVLHGQSLARHHASVQSRTDSSREPTSHYARRHLPERARHAAAPQSCPSPCEPRGRGSGDSQVGR
ncbi:MAG: hypothetical protein JWP14_392 [Frankiales bacterium]|nr:hypothetical protein [Frankiales bacterium]